MAKIGQSVFCSFMETLFSLLNQSADFLNSPDRLSGSRLVVSCSAIRLSVSSNLRDILRESFMLVFFLGAAFFL